MTSFVLCRPTAQCDERNMCVRYRTAPDSGDKIEDYSKNGKIQDDETASRRRCSCWWFLPVFDSDNCLMPQDWQESKL